ncbi:MAG: hypothetical protein J1F07_01470 [Muribaculaceae bacterium]|nr:hypothetical protein [Muribaculaceae bacterium]
MKKIKLKDPIASMVMCGALDIIPCPWDTVNPEEKIFIYCDGVDCSFANAEFDFSKELHRRIYNEFFFGNLPSIIGEEGFMGYVMIDDVVKQHKGYNQNYEDSIVVKNPSRFSNRLEDFDLEFEHLLRMKTSIPKLNRMKIIGDVLYVPVGERIWEKLKTNQDWDGLAVAYEPYMAGLAPNPFNLNEKREPISKIVFIRNGRKIWAESDGAGISFIPILNKKNNKIPNNDDQREILYIFVFGITTLSSDGSTIISNCVITDNPKPIFTYCKNYQMEIHKPQKDFVKILYTPMGGMTHWKR